MTTLLLTIIICGGLFAALLFSGKGWGQGGTTPSSRDLRQAIYQTRGNVQAILERKCRPLYPVQYRNVWKIPGPKVKPILSTWQGRQPKVRALRSRCATVNARALRRWFNTSGAACIKSKEGAWTSNTGNGYYGGFQADMSFQRAYGREYLNRWGTANYWPPVAQIHMAYRGWRARGWYPWPNTARACGLL